MCSLVPHTQKYLLIFLKYVALNWHEALKVLTSGSGCLIFYEILTRLLLGHSIIMILG